MFRSATTPAATAAVVALALAPLLAACGSAASGSEPDAAGSSRAAGFGELEDTAWVTVTRADVAGAPITLKKGSRLSLEFVDGRVGADAGCNALGGDAEIVDGRLEISGGLAMTEMACPGLMRQEQWYGDFLASSPRIEVDGETLTLAAGEVTITFTDRDVVDGPAAVEGVTWRLESVTRTRGNSASGTGGPWYRKATLRLEDGHVGGRSGCNGYGADAALEGDRLRVSEVISTKMACSRARMRVERAFHRVLESDPVWSVSPTTLTLTTPNGKLGLQFRKAGAR